jgi:hypothetical protein
MHTDGTDGLPTGPPNLECAKSLSVLSGDYLNSFALV